MSSIHNSGTVASPLLASNGVGAITLSNLNQHVGNLTLGGSSIFSGLMEESLNIKKVMMIESTTDILAVSSCWYRLKQENNTDLQHRGHIRLTNNFLFESVNQDDRVMAGNIRDYYSKKIMMWKLKDKKLSNFRISLADFITGNGLLWKEDYGGMITRLPEFYHYDCEMDKIVEAHFKREAKSGQPNTVKALVPINALVRRTKHQHKVDYWFKTSDLEEPVKMTVDAKNELRFIWDSLFNSKSTLAIQGSYMVSTLGDFAHYMLKPANVINTISIHS